MNEQPRVFQDGDQWCALTGENLQVGTAGFGATAAEALAAWAQAAYAAGQPGRTVYAHLNRGAMPCGCPSPYHRDGLCPAGTQLRRQLEQTHARAAEVAWYLHFLRQGYQVYVCTLTGAWREAFDQVEREREAAAAPPLPQECGRCSRSLTENERAIGTCGDCLRQLGHDV